MACIFSHCVSTHMNVVVIAITNCHNLAHTVHFKCHIHDMPKSVLPSVIAAMLSLSTTEAIPNLEATFSLIHSSRKKAAGECWTVIEAKLLRILLAWLDDKFFSSKFAFPGIYWPTSRIPLEVWKASPPKTNGNEQSHRNINRDGMGLTLLAGVMQGLHYDRHAKHGIKEIAKTGVQMREEVATHHNCKRRTINCRAVPYCFASYYV